MKIVGVIALAALMLLFWLCFSGADTCAPEDAHEFAVFNHFSATECILRERILEARLGIMKNYICLDNEVNVLDNFAPCLEGNCATLPTLAKQHDLLFRQGALVEKIKSEKAFPRTALAYLGLLTNLNQSTPDDRAPIAHIAPLSTTMLDLMIEPSGNVARSVYDELKHLAADQMIHTNVDLKNGLPVHGWTRYKFLPAIGASANAMYEIPFAEPKAVIRGQIAARRRRLQVAANRYQLTLYMVSFLFLLLVVLLGGNLIASVAALRRRVAFEQTMTAISSRFVETGWSEMRSAVEAALADLASLVGADRACFILSPPQETYLWARERATWPRETPIIRADVLAQPDAILYFPSIDRMPASSDKDMLLQRGIRGWLYVPGHSDGFVVRILEFEAQSGPMVWPSADLGLLRVAADNIANAVQRARFEREHTRLEASLEARSRMETVGALAAGVAHDFNNVIAAILGYVETQRMHLTPESHAARCAEGVRQAAEHARDLVDQVLHFGTQTVRLPRQVSLAGLMARTKAQLIGALPNDTQILVRDIPEEAVIWGKASQLQQVITNLCINAHQAMGQGGTINVTLGFQRNKQALELSHGMLTPGTYAQLNVSDTGIGMDEESLERLFEPFFTTKAHGNGLGLATALEIVRAHGGAINVHSVSGQGSVFEVFLPLVTSGQPVHSAIMPRGRGEAILIVQEDATRMLHHEEIVAALGYEPVGYAGWDEALSALRTEPNKFDTILLVSRLSLEKDLAFAAKVHEIAPQLPIVLAASHHGLTSKELAFAGISIVIHAPVVAAELAAALAQWVATPVAPRQ
jgi:signal transduction histidine kinase